MVNTKELSLVIHEANTLSGKASLNKQEERRLTFLMSAAAAIKAGASLVEIEQENFNEESRRQGLPTVSFSRDRLTNEQRDTASLWKYAAEQRDVEGAPMLNHIGVYSGLGQFIPNDFFANVFSQLKTHDPLFDEDSCTVINSTNGRVTTVPTVGDIEAVASVVGEAGAQTETDISVPSQAVLGVYSYKSPRWVCSIEAFQDLSEVIGAVKLFTDFASDRLRRGIGADLVNGSGISKPLGLISSLVELASSATPFTTASGSAGNTGGAETGANSIGTKDLSNLYYSVDAAYRSSAKCAWLMQDATLNYIDGLVDKMGQPLHIVKWDNGKPSIYGKPVKISPSVPAIGSSNVTVLFGDLSYWVTKIVTGIGGNGIPLSYVQTYQEALGLIENGLIGFRAFLRAGGVLACDDPNSPAPINYLMQHS
jgi:HK97 family phage major capsid protein